MEVAAGVHPERGERMRLVLFERNPNQGEEGGI